jgi:hypothetical protein
MSFLLSLAVVGAVFLILLAVQSVIDVGQKNARLRALSTASAALDRQARKPGWRRVPGDEDVPAGRMGEAERTRHAAVAGTHAGRAVRVAVFAASMPDGTFQSVPIRWAVLPGLVLVVDVPELRGNLMVNPIQGSRRYGVLGSLEPLMTGEHGRKVFAQLTSYKPPGVDIRDGIACFTFTDMNLADQVDDLVAMACDVVELLVDVRKVTPLGEDQAARRWVS